MNEDVGGNGGDGNVGGGSAQPIVKRVGKPTVVLGILMLLGDVLAQGWPTLEGLIMPFLGAFSLALVMIAVADRLPLGVKQKAAVIFGVSYVVMAINVVIELKFFSTMPPRELFFILFTNLWQLAPFSLVLAKNSAASADPRPPAEGFSTLFGSRSAGAWLWRVPASAILFILVYFVVGAVAYTFTAPYYNDPTLGLNLLVPSLGVILPLQGFRALLYLLPFIPVMGYALSRPRGVGTLFGAVLFVGGALTPLLANTEWPVELRFYHGVEGLFLGFLSGWAMMGVLMPRSSIKT